MISQQDSFTAFYTFFLIKKILISIFYDMSGSRELNSSSPYKWE